MVSNLIGEAYGAMKGTKQIPKSIEYNKKKWCIQIFN